MLENDQPAEYLCQGNLNLYDSPALDRLATQAIAGRQLRISSVIDSSITETAIAVCLCEDDYPGWMAAEDQDLLVVTDTPFQPIALSATEIQSRIPKIIAYTQTAMHQPNHYLWGGTVGPNYDCSGLVQTAFASTDIWIPRDAYQQEAFVQPIALDTLQPGDLIFFGRDRCTHVALYLEDGCYIHSSGKDQGRNGIGIDRLSTDAGTISQTYYHQLRGAGRVVRCYSPL